jgi:hypothetical protein
MSNLRKAAISAVAVGAAITGGAIGASVVGTAGAQTDNSSSSSTTAPANNGAPAGNNAPAHDPSQGGHTANGITETLLTGDTATKVSDAAKGAVPDATIDRVETDAEGATYEAHMTKSDGSHVTVKVNADFSVAGVEDGPGAPR